MIFAFFCTWHTVQRLSYRAFLLFVLIVEAEWSTGKYGVYYFYIRDSFSLGSDEGCLIQKLISIKLSPPVQIYILT